MKMSSKLSTINAVIIIIIASLVSTSFCQDNNNNNNNNNGNLVDFNTIIITDQAIGAMSVFAADVNGDGLVDVLSACYDNNQIAWHKNLDNSGKFSAPIIISNQAIKARSVFAADVNGDGLIDVLSASESDDKIAWYKNLGNNGQFSAPIIISDQAIGASSVFAADVNGDGFIDVLSAYYGDNAIAWYKNLGNDGQFSAPIIINDLAMYAQSVFAADVNGDHLIDVLSASYNDNTIAWYKNLGNDGQFSAPIVISNQSILATSVFAADVNGDGLIDVLSASVVNNNIAWYKNLGNDGQFSAQIIINDQALGASSVFAADVNGDHLIDVLSASTQDNTIAWYKNLGNDGQFSAPIIISNQALSAQSVFAADVNGDGLIDVLSASMYDNKIAWYKNLGDNNEQFSAPILISDQALLAQSVFAADVNGDNFIDVLSASFLDNKIAWYKNLGNSGQFSDQIIISNQVYGATSVFAADVNGDGLIDVLSASFDSGKIAYYARTEDTGHVKITVSSNEGNDTLCTKNYSHPCSSMVTTMNNLHNYQIWPIRSRLIILNISDTIYQEQYPIVLGLRRMVVIINDLHQGITINCGCSFSVNNNNNNNNSTAQQYLSFYKHHCVSIRGTLLSIVGGPLKIQSSCDRSHRNDVVVVDSNDNENNIINSGLWLFQSPQLRIGASVACGWYGYECGGMDMLPTKSRADIFAYLSQQPVLTVNGFTSNLSSSTPSLSSPSLLSSTPGIHIEQSSKLYVSGQTLITNCSTTSNNNNIPFSSSSSSSSLSMIVAGGMSIISSTNIFINEVLINNCSSMNGNGGGLLIQDSEVATKSLILLNNQAVSGSGGGMHLSGQSSYLSIHKQFIMQNNTALLNGGGINIDSTGPLNLGDVMIQGSISWSNNQALTGSGGALFMSQSSLALVLADSNIHHNQALNGNGGAIAMSSSWLNWTCVNNTNNNNNNNQSCEIHDNIATTGGALYAEQSLQMSTINNVKIINNQALSSNQNAGNGGGIGLFLTSFTLMNVLIDGNQASNTGGGISCVGSTISKNAQISMSSNSRISNNRAMNGGGIALDNCYAMIINASLDLNIATITSQPQSSSSSYPKGGAIYIAPITTSSSSISTIPILVDISNSNIANNQATTGGGGMLYWNPTFNYNNNNNQDSSGIYAPMMRIQNVIIFNNTAIYGNNVASSPVVLQICNETENAISQLNQTSGNINNGSLDICLYDIYNHQVLADNFSFLQIILSNIIKTNSIYGTSNYQAQAGRFDLTDQFGVIATPGGLYNLQFIPNVNSASFTLNTITISIRLRECNSTAGEFLTNNNRLCDKCQTGLYSVLTECKSCPSGADCVHGIAISRANVWLIMNQKTQQYHDYSCPPGYCLNNFQCEDNRKDYEMNPLCGECEVDYYEWGGQCVSCDNAQPAAWIISGLIIGLIFVMIYHELSQSRSAELGILIMFIQLAFLFTSPAQISSLIEFGILNLRFLDGHGLHRCFMAISSYNKLLLRKFVFLFACFFVFDCFC